MSFRKSLAEHPYVSRRDAPRLARVPKHHFRQSVFGNLFKGLGSQSTQSGLNCSYPVTGPSSPDALDRNILDQGDAALPVAPGGSSGAGCAEVITSDGLLGLPCTEALRLVVPSLSCLCAHTPYGECVLSLVAQPLWASEPSLDSTTTRQIVQVRHLVHYAATSQPHLGSRLSVFDF